MDPRQTGTNNSTKHFNPRLACHGFYELQKDNKAFVYSGLKRCPSVMWRSNKRASCLCRWSLRWRWMRYWESRRSRSQTTRFPSLRCVFTPFQAWPSHCSPAPETATPWWPKQLVSRHSLPPNRYSVTHHPLSPPSENQYRCWRYTTTDMNQTVCHIVMLLG